MIGKAAMRSGKDKVASCCTEMHCFCSSGSHKCNAYARANLARDIGVPRGIAGRSCSSLGTTTLSFGRGLVQALAQIEELPFCGQGRLLSARKCVLDGERPRGYAVSTTPEGGGKRAKYNNDMAVGYLNLRSELPAFCKALERFYSLSLAGLGFTRSAAPGCTL